jgi:hypothetical protein
MTYVGSAITAIAGVTLLTCTGTAHGQIFLEPRTWAVSVSLNSPPPPAVVNAGPPMAMQQVAPPEPAPSPLHIVQADAIQAAEVRADTIYANRINAKQINGTVHRQPDMPLRTQGRMGVPSVVASTIYANRIDAGTVTAANIYVREIGGTDARPGASSEKPGQRRSRAPEPRRGGDRP